MFIGGGVIVNFFPLGSAAWTVAYSLTMIVLITPILAWHYSIYRAASDRSLVFVGHRGRRGFLFGLCATGLAIFLITFPIGRAFEPGSALYRALLILANTTMILGCVTYFVAIWAAANALTRFDEQKKQVATHKTLGSAFLQMYFPIGIWFIHRRIKRMLASPLPERIAP